MDRIDRIIRNEKFIALYDKCEELEKDRIFCKHDRVHLLNVARIAAIIAEKENLPLDRELIYAAALLHDIGRAAQYEEGISHEEAALKPAEEILRESSFTGEEIISVLDAIKNHRRNSKKSDSILADLLFRADKLSRDCYFCKARKECNWTEEEKNNSIEY